MTTTDVTLRSYDEHTFNLSRDVASRSNTIKNLLDDMQGQESSTVNDLVPLPNVKGDVLAKVITYIQNDDNSQPEFLKGFFDVDQPMLFSILLAANYLDIPSLLDTACAHVAGMITGKSPEEIRQTFGIKNDLTPEEEEKLRADNAWAYEL